MTAIQGTFDASQFNPEQGVGKHPIGKKFPAVIKMTSIDATKDNTGGYLSVLFETPSGQIVRNYNLWNSNPQAVEIAQKQLSALCHATGVFKLDWSNEGAALCGAPLTIDVDPQTKNPEYNEVSKVYDKNGNEPGKPPANAPQPQNGAAWGTAQPQPNNAPPAAVGGWGAQPPPNANAAPGWTQNNTETNKKPPWG